MMVHRTRWSLLAVLAVFVVSTVAGCDEFGGTAGTSGGGVQVCCNSATCGQTCDQDNCGDWGDDASCCPESIALSTTVCGVDNAIAPCTLDDSDEDDDDTPVPTPAPTPAETESIEPEPIQDYDDDDALSSTEGCEDYGGTAGTSGGGVEVCCATAPCQGDSDEDVQDTPVPTPAPTPAETESIEPEPIQDDDDDALSSTEDTPVGAIAGGVVAGILVIGAVMLGVLFKTVRLKSCRGSSSNTSADDATPAPPSGPMPAGNGRLQAIQGHSSQHPGHVQYPVAFQYPEAL